MRKQAEFRKIHLSSGLAAILGFLLLAANIVMDVSPAWPAVFAATHSARTVGPNG